MSRERARERAKVAAEHRILATEHMDHRNAAIVQGLLALCHTIDALRIQLEREETET